jgi:Holliday junction resolvase RusA-like endonuclease
MRIKIKPLSVNDAWQGRRFKTVDYKIYERSVSLLLNGKSVDIPDGNLSIYIEFGFSNFGADWDNPIKPLLDILQKQYSFNDNRVFEARIVKKVVKKGEEYIEFEITKAP